MGRCKVPDCSGITEYDENAQAELCTTCGTVTSEGVLTQSWDGEHSGSSLYLGPATLMSLRRVGAGLAGQSSKEARDKRDTAAIHQYIHSLITRLRYHLPAARAQTLFDQARAHKKFRWGKQAHLVAGACVLSAIREGKGRMKIPQLAGYMDVSSHALCRMFTQIRTLLGLKVPDFDFISIIPDLESHLIDITSSPPSFFPKALTTMLQGIPSSHVLQLASSFAMHLAHMQNYTAADVFARACALFIIAIEGVAGSSLPSYTLLAEALGTRMGISKALIIKRYREISAIVEGWIAAVPWLSGANQPDNKLGPKKRKIGRRHVIAIGLKDAIKFRGDLPETTVDERRLITVSLEVDESGDSESSMDDEASQSGRKRKRSKEPDDSRPSKALRLIRVPRTKSSISRFDLASLFLLSPLHPLTTNPSQGEFHGVDSLQHKILTSPFYQIQCPLTRLQLLVASRGGESKIEDEELFAPDELEGFLRNEEEVVKLRILLDWNDIEPDPGIREFSSPDASPRLSQSEWDVADMAFWETVGNDNDNDKYS